jgi:diadenosine tetraphosphate (Ap4A) HIT family hydrolase
MQNPRTVASQVAYNEFKAGRATTSEKFDFADETIIKEYQYWYIIKNRFPYDTMVRINDMLVSKRAVSTFKELNQAELAEYDTIIDEISAGATYDAKIENFPHVQSVSQHVHVHLVCWHNTAK